MVNRKIMIAILVLALAGVADSAYALNQHYAPVASSCDINETVSCTAVNQSEDSLFFGIPVAALGIGGYLLMAVLAGSMALGLIRQSLLIPLLTIVALGGLAFSARLTYIEIFRLNAVCPLCVTSQILVAVIALLTFIGFLRSRTGAA